MTKSTERPRTRGHHKTTPGAQMLKPSEEYLIFGVAERVQKKYLEFKKKYGSLKAPRPKTFKEFQEEGKISGQHRSKRSIPQCTLEPNHSHFIFADDGSLDHGTEAKLRADVESCAAGVYKGVGVMRTGAGDKILQRIDDEITRMLVDSKLNQGWENAGPLVPEKETETSDTTDRKVIRCKGVGCDRFIWGDQPKCKVCLSNEAIKEKLQGNTSPAFESIPRARVIVLKYVCSNNLDPIKIESNQEQHEIEKEIEKHKDALTRLRSKAHLDSSPDVYVKAQILQSMLYSDFI